MKKLIAILIIVANGIVVFGADWPQWRGPERNGISKETGLVESLAGEWAATVVDDQ